MNTTTRTRPVARHTARRLQASIHEHTRRGAILPVPPVGSRTAKRALMASRVGRVDNRLMDTHLAGVKLVPGQWEDGTPCYAVIRAGVDIGTITRHGSYIEVLGAFTSNDAQDLPGAVDICVEMRDRWEGR